MRAVVIAGLIGLLSGATPHARETILSGWFDLPVPGGAATLAAFGITPEERALTLTLLARAFEDRRYAVMPAVDVNAPRTDIPVPLSAESWRRLLELQRDQDLFPRFVADRSALLLAAALTATHDSIRALAMRDRDLLRALYRDGTGGFAIVSRSLRIAGDRVAVPGGAGADALWQDLVGVAPTRPADFIRALSTKDNGRLAWYYDTIAGLDGPRLAAAWPSGFQGSASQLIYDVFRNSDPQVRLSDQPFRRSIADAWTVMALTDLRDHAPAGPAWLALWELLFAGTDVTREQAERVTTTTSPGRLSLAWLTNAVVMNAPRERRDRFEMFRLAQRVFRDVEPSAIPDIAVALSGYRRYRALLLALERMEIAAPATWASAVEAAHHVRDHGGDDREAFASFQAAIALIDCIRHVRTIDAATADSLIQSLSLAVRGDRRIVPAIGRWITAALVPALPRLERPDAWTRSTAYESVILQALVGRPPARPLAIEWEGLQYRIDRSAAERERLHAVRRLLPSPGLDSAIESGDRRAISEALMAIVYSIALGAPEGPAALSREVAQRHDFGLRATSIVREQRPWAPPEERQGAGPWHIQGAVIGLDLGLSRLALRRVADGMMPAKPVLTLNDLGTLTRTVVALVPEELHDAERDELAAAIARGRRRVLEAQGDLAKVTALAREAKMSASAREVLPWMLARQPDDVPGLFALRDLLWLGHPQISPERLDRWGVSGDGLDARRVTVFPAAAPWEDFAGRADLGQISTQVPDLTLRLVEETARLKLPAELIPALLAFATDDYWHETQARFSDDWPLMVRQAAAIEAVRVEDYVAALTGSGPLRAQ